MTPIEQFMAEYFRERTKLYRAEIELLKPLRQAYFTPECSFDSRRCSVERSEAERIVSVSQGEGETLVITTGLFRTVPLRYHLRPTGDSWAIHHVAFKCSSCQGDQCVICGGRGWITPSDD
jgi:hypothetical protein